MTATLLYPMLRRAMASLLLLFAICMPAMAQQWPGKTVRIMVPFGAGSTPDVVARLIADGLAKKYPDSIFLVENKPGASGNFGTDAVAKAPPDGSTIGISIGGPLAINTLLFSKLPYDPAKDIAPITQLVTQASVLVVNRELKVNTVAELVALLRNNPGKYNFSSIGNGSLSHLVMEVIALTARVQLTHVPYTSSPQAITAVIRNDVQMACLPAISATPHAAAGTLKILAVSTAKRSPFLPDVPTLQEAGIDVEVDAWNGLIASGRTPKSLIAKINKEVVEIIKQPAVRDKLATQMMEVVGGSPEEFRKLIQTEVKRWTPVIKATKIKIN